MRLVHFSLRSSVTFFLILFSFNSFADTEDTIDSAQLAAIETTLLNKQYAKAWSMVSDIQEQFEGLSEFDFLFARVAIENKKYELAIFALNRVLIDEPNNYRVHLEMGRALFFNHNLEQAKNHFNFVLESKPPQAVIERINQFNSAIDDLIKQRRTQKIMSLSAIIGATDNVNSAPDSLILTPEYNAQNLTQLSDSSKKRSDAFINLLGTIGIQKPIDTKSHYRATTSLNIKQGNDSEGINDLLNLSGTLTYSKSINDFTLSPYSQININNVGDNFSGVGLILGVQSSYTISKRFLNATSLTAAVNSDSEFDLENYNATLSNTLIFSQTKHQHALSLALISFSLEDTASQHNAFTAFNLGYSLNSRFSNQFKNTFSSNIIAKIYQTEDPFFLDPNNISDYLIRKDNQITLSNQFTFVKSQHQQYFAKLTALQQTSNIEIYNLVKFDFSLGLNLQF